jgi:hypothetical protein
MYWTLLWSFADYGLFSSKLPGNVDDCGQGDVEEGCAIHDVHYSHCCEGANDEELEEQAIMKRLPSVVLDGVLNLSRSRQTWHDFYYVLNNDLSHYEQFNDVAELDL